MEILTNVGYLPMEIVEHEILSYLNEKQLLLTNKNFYEKYMAKLRFGDKEFSYKNTGIGLDGYIKKIVLNRYDYIFSLLIKEKYNRWIKRRKFYYKGYKYNHYIDWLEQLCYDLNSTACRNTILDYERNNNKVRKKKHKKMKTINNRWSN